ncbi:DUF1126 domain-containing protein [Rhodococcus cerastii]|nr:DUF1126 domain-containing protein [Rhodococcus cerastii]
MFLPTVVPNPAIGMWGSMLLASVHVFEINSGRWGSLLLRRRLDGILPLEAK